MVEQEPAKLQEDPGETLLEAGAVQIGAPVSALGQDVNKSMLDRDLAVSGRGPFAIALGLHLLVFAAALVLPRYFSGTHTLTKPIIAKMVALGKPRDQKLLPRKEEPASPPSAPRAAPSTVPAPASRLPKTPAQVANAKDPVPKNAPRPLSRQEQMARALAGVGADVEKERKQKPPEEREGLETGSEAGTAATEEEGDRYFAAVLEAIRAHYVLPSIISERDLMTLQATVVAFIARDGAIIRYEFEKRSGNRNFDDALERALKQTTVPPPPPDREHLVRNGVALVFTP